MSPIVRAALLCDYAVTGQDGKLSIIGIFSTVNFPSVPNAYPRFFVVMIVALDQGTHEVRIGILDPGGQQLLPEQPTAEVSVELPGADTNLVVDFNNLPFNRGGIHQVQLFLDGRLIHSIPLTVQAAGQGIAAQAE